MQITDGLHGFLWDSPRVNNCNTYLIDAGVRILIDPGHTAYFDHVRHGLEALGIMLEDIDLVLGTHAHPDHVEAVTLFRELPARFALHGEEWRLVEEMAPLLKASLGVEASVLKPDFFIAEGPLNVRGVALHVYHAPGHAPGGVCLHWPETGALFSGDLIFAGGLGRTDLPGGDAEALKASIRRMAGLNGVRYLLPGHGPIVEGVEAVRRNFESVERAWFAYI
ncbi:MAG: MBL fold metallo-hydrolase [Desulfobacteraceae bacterium]|nr:MBL fold metallo-hydrolase [Desulfobacteraceae bacterium]